MLCESLKKKAVLVFSVSMGNRLEIDLARIIIIVIGFRKQNRPRGLSVYNNNNDNKKELDQNQESSPLLR